MEKRFKTKSEADAHLLEVLNDMERKDKRTGPRLSQEKRDLVIEFFEMLRRRGRMH